MGLPLDADFWWWTISFQICAISAWTTAFTLIYSFFVKKENPLLQFLYRVLLGVALVGAGLALIYPDMIDEVRPFFHFRNLQTIVTHALIVFVPIYLLKAKRIVVQMSDLWKVGFGWFAAICISMSASLINGQNFGFALRCSLMEDIGIFIPFPFHLSVLGAIMMFISFLIYGGIFLSQKKIRTLTPKIKYRISDTKTYIESILIFIAAIIVAAFSLTIISLAVFTPSWWGALALLPIPLTGGLLYLGFRVRKKALTIL